MKSLLHDYAEACKDIAVGAKERPGKAALYLSVITGAVLCGSNAPSDDSFHCSMLDAAGTLLLLSPWTRNGKSDRHTQRLIDLDNQGRLHHANLVFLSVMYESPHDPACDVYHARCPHLEPRWVDFPGRVLDVGFLGRWWVLRSRMKDFDVNDEEFAHLPPDMRTISWRDLHSQENEKLYVSKFLPVVMPEEQLD
ncbi:mitochondrial import inner membrane translocase subunit Tim29 isoform X1 [Ascaphus truei]